MNVETLLGNNLYQNTRKEKKEENNPTEHYISPLCLADPAGPICTIFGT